jgi:predicted 3-demethylubiquinone-9 3-methyltransferase (glyoxalase superfamily)
MAKKQRKSQLVADPVGSVLTIEFELEGQKFVALNGGPLFKFNESISFVVNCEAQEEVDYFWEKLIANGGQESACGWLKDKFGLSWQVVPRVLIDMLQDKNPKKSERVMKAMLQMTKIDIETLENAYVEIELPKKGLKGDNHDSRGRHPRSRRRTIFAL